MSRREGVYNRAGEPSVPFCGKGGARERADGFFFAKGKKEAGAKRTLLRRGAADGGRTRTALLPRDFKSRVSANFTTAAYQYSIVLAIPSKVKEECRRSMGKKERPLRAALSPGIPGVKQKTVGRDPPFF